MSENYTPYGDDWKDEMMKFSKAELISMMKKEFSKQESCLISSVDFAENTVTFDIPKKLRRARWSAGVLLVDFTDVVFD